MAANRLQHNHNILPCPLSLFYQTNPNLYYSMRLASKQGERMPQGMRDNHPDMTKWGDRIGQLGYEGLQSKNFMRIDDGTAYTKSKKKITCTSPTSMPGSKRQKGGATYANGKAIDEYDSGRVVKNSNRKQGQNPLQSTQFLNKTHSNFKNKQSKDATRTINTARPIPYKKADALSTDRLRKYKQMLSPSRNIKNKSSSTHSKKLLRSTQETFTIVSKNAAKRSSTLRRSPSKVILTKEPQEYLLLDDHFLSINHDEADLLEQKISFNQCIRQNFPIYLLNRQHELSMDEEDSFPTDKTFQKSQASSESIQKVILIQRWWRSVLIKKTSSLNPIIFDRNQRELVNQGCMGVQRCKQWEAVTKKNEMCHLQFVECNNLNVSISESKQRTRSLNPLGLRQQLARQQQRVYKELLDKLFKLGKITPQIYKGKNEAVQAKFQKEIQTISDIKRLLNQNTLIVHEKTQKIKEDCEKIDNVEGQLSRSFLDSIFGSNIENDKEKASLECIQAQASTVINRQKSKGCHFQGKEEAISFYSKEGKTLQQQYAQDFQQSQIQSSQIQQNEQAYNTNFGQILEQYKKQQQATMEIDQRAAIQMGMFIPDLLNNQSVGIDTSLNGIHHFLLSFFKFYICFYKDEFLRLINMPYGYDVNRRVKFLQGYDVQDYYPEEDDDGIIYGLEDVIHEDILDQYYARMQNASQDPQSSARRVNDQFEKMHNRALFDCFNAALNQFRPYFQINGTPYPWNYSQKALTFYSIAEENIQQVFEKTQFKVLKWGSSLCGIIVQSFCNPCPLISPQTGMDDALYLYKDSMNPSLFKAREERFNREVKLQMSEANNASWGMYEDQLTLLYLQCSEFAVGKLIQEFVLEFYLSGLLGTPLSPQEQFKECRFQ